MKDRPFTTAVYWQGKREEHKLNVLHVTSVCDNSHPADCNKFVYSIVGNGVANTRCEWGM